MRPRQAMGYEPMGYEAAHLRTHDMCMYMLLKCTARVGTYYRSVAATQKSGVCTPIFT